MICCKSVKISIVLFTSLLTLIACSKEEEPVKPYEYTPASYDVGYLMVKINGNPAIVDSIEYTNQTRGVKNTVDLTKLVYYPASGTSVLSMAFANGNIGDDVQCCIFINTLTSAGVEFEFIPSDSITMTPILSNIHCEVGKY